MADPVPCPACSRANAAHRTTCLYCGAVMPSPQPRPAAAAPVGLPTNLDALVREALSGGDIGKLRSAMSQAGEVEAPPPVPMKTERPRPSSPPPARLSPPPSLAHRGTHAHERAAPPLLSVPELPLDRAMLATERLVRPNGDGLANALHEVLAAVQTTLAVHERGEAVHPGLSAIRRSLDHACALAPPAHADSVLSLVESSGPEPTPSTLLVPLPDDPPIPLPVAPSRERPPVVLPKYRRRWLLVIQGPGNADLTEAMARALNVDGVSARFAAIARAPRVVLRSETPTELRRSALKVQKLGVAAVVVSRDELESIASPDLVLASDGDARLSVSASWPWNADVPEVLPADARSLPLSGMSIGVPGEISVRRYRIGRSLARGRRSDRVLRLSTERRFAVVDLHGPGRFLRLIAGITNTSGMPGHDERSAVQSFQGLVERLPEWVRSCVVQSDRVCSAGEAPPIPDGHDGAAPIESSGWSAWEEHTRLCRLLGGLSSHDVPVERA